MRLVILTVLFAVGYAQIDGGGNGPDKCVDSGPNVTFEIPGWKTNAACWELDYDLDCHVFDAKKWCPRKCKRCVGDCEDGTHDIRLENLGDLYCSQVHPSYGDCRQDNVSVYCPNTCNSCLADSSGVGPDSDAVAANADAIEDNAEAIETNRSNISDEANQRQQGDDDIKEQMGLLAASIGDGGGGSGFAGAMIDGALELQCETTFESLVAARPQFLVKPFQVLCPDNCASAIEGNVTGSQPFTASSAICAAAALYGATPRGNDSYITVIPWTPVRQGYIGVQRGPYSSAAQDTWEAGFIIQRDCPVLSISEMDKGSGNMVPIGYFHQNVDRADFKQWVFLANESETKYFEVNQRNYWRMQTKTTNWNTDVCYASGKTPHTRDICEAISGREACISVSPSHSCYWGRYNSKMANSAGDAVDNPCPKDDYTLLRGCTGATDRTCRTFGVIECKKLRDGAGNDVCTWTTCADGEYYSHCDGDCKALPSHAMECSTSRVLRHGGLNGSFPTVMSRDPSAQVPMRLEMKMYGDDDDEWESASLCTTRVDVACLDGALLQCPGDIKTEPMKDNHKATITIQSPAGVLMDGMDVKVRITGGSNVPNDWNNGASEMTVEVGDIVVLPMKAGLTMDPDRTSTYILEYIGEDYIGNEVKSECSVEIKDNQPPRFIPDCSTWEEIELTLNPDSHQATIRYPPKTAVDNVDGNLEVVCKYKEDEVQELLDYGETRLKNTCTATDWSGNQSQCEFQIVIRDEEFPRLECNIHDKYFDMDRGRPDKLVSWAHEMPTATDAGSGAHKVPLPITTTIIFEDKTEKVLPQGVKSETFPRGTHEVRFEACDLYTEPNCSRCQFFVTVVDSTPPDIICPETQYIRLDFASQGSPVKYDKPTCEDNYDETCTPAYDKAYGDVVGGTQFVRLTGDGDVITDIGIYTVQWYATDSSGNSSQCAFKVVLYQGCFTYKFEWDEWVNNSWGYVGLQCRGGTTFKGMSVGNRVPCDNDALYLDLSEEHTNHGGQVYNVWESYQEDMVYSDRSRDYLEWEPSWVGSWKLEFHLNEVARPHAPKQFSFYGNVRTIEGSSEWVWLMPVLDLSIPINDLKHTLKIYCGDNFLCPKITPRTRSTEPKIVEHPPNREIGKNTSVRCSNGYFARGSPDGINFCCEPSGSGKQPHWNVCSHNAGTCEKCDKPLCDNFRPNSCECEDCSPGFVKTENGDCAPSCTGDDVRDNVGDNCGVHGRIAGFIDGDDNQCYCLCDEGWNVNGTCTEPENQCPDNVDGTIYAGGQGTKRTDISPAERAKDATIYVDCKAGYSGALEFECRVNSSNEANWVFKSHSCKPYQCETKIANPGQSCNNVCQTKVEQTCSATALNEAKNDDERPAFVLLVKGTSELGNSCERYLDSDRPYAPYFSAGHTKDCYFQDVDGAQCHLRVDNEQQRICVCCPGCLVTATNPKVSLHWDWLGPGNTMFELIDNPDPKILCGNPAGEPSGFYNPTNPYTPYNFSNDMFNPRHSNGDACNQSEDLRMPPVCDGYYQSTHWILGSRFESCTGACNGIKTDDDTSYSCDADTTANITTPLRMRNMAIKAGTLCEKYPSSGAFESFYPAIEASNDNCYYRLPWDSQTGGTTGALCGTAPDNAQMRRLCACKKN